MAKTDEVDPLQVYAQWLDDGDIPDADFSAFPNDPSDYDDERDDIDGEEDADDEERPHMRPPMEEDAEIPTRHPSQAAGQPQPDVFQSSPVVPEIATKSEERVQADMASPAPTPEPSPVEESAPEQAPVDIPEPQPQPQPQPDPATAQMPQQQQPQQAQQAQQQSQPHDESHERTFTEERTSSPKKARKRPKVSAGAFASASVKAFTGGDDDVDPFAEFGDDSTVEVDSSVYRSQEFEIQLIYTVREAARIARMKNTEQQTVKKKGQGNFVTEVDIAIENFLKEQLIKLLPGSGFITEEAESQVVAGCNWVIDPIDGTTNYLNGLPYVISLALVAAGRTELGVVYSCADDKVFYAQRGCGAFVDDGPGRNKIHVKEWEEDEGLLFFGCPYNRKKGPAIFARASRLYPYYSDIKRIGPAALDICMVAQGTAQLYMEFDLKLWDVAAGMLILKEAGGCYEITTDNMLLFGTKESIAQAVEKLDLTLKQF